MEREREMERDGERERKMVREREKECAGARIHACPCRGQPKAPRIVLYFCPLYCLETVSSSKL